jgi:hypothetical protein
VRDADPAFLGLENKLVLGCYFHVLYLAQRRGRSDSIFAHPLEVKGVSFLDFLFHLLDRGARSNAAGKIWDIGGKLFSALSMTIA